MEVSLPLPVPVVAAGASPATPPVHNRSLVGNLPTNEVCLLKNIVIKPKMTVKATVTKI